MHLHLVTIHAMPSPQAVPLAAACLKAYLDSRSAKKITVTCAEFFSGTAIEAIAAAVTAVKADIVALPLYLWNREEGCRLASVLRRERPEVTIIAGGPEATADPRGVLAEGGFDFLVTGEGELTLAEVVEALAAGKAAGGIPGTARLDGGRLVSIPRPQIDDLSILPSPWLAGLLDAHIPNGVVWQLSRGCSFGCDFCFDGMGDRRVRRYPLERLEAELDYFLQRGVSQIFVLDSTFNQDVKRAKTILRLAAKKAPHVHFHFEVRHELLDEEQASLFARLTCSLQIGLQSADPEVARGVSRNLKREDFAAKVMLLNEAGAIFGFDLIYGLPGDSLSRFRKGLDFALSLYPNHLDIFPLSVLPGTALAARREKLGLQHLPAPPYTLLESPTFPAADMATAGKLRAACDIFYSRGKAVAWFNGVLAALRVDASEFLEKFSVWLQEKYGRQVEESDLTDGEILALQRDFLAMIFTAAGKKKLLPLALDFAEYHFHYAASVMAVPPEIPPARQLRRLDPLKLPLRRPQSTRLAVFSYEILELLDSGEPDLVHLARTLRPSRSFAVIYPLAGEVRTESLAEPFFRLLELLDGKKVAAAAATATGVPAADAREFLLFALEEGIAVG